MTRVAVARAVSIVGHPVVVMLVAALIVASTRGASLQQLKFVGGALVTLGAVVLGFSWVQVRTGRWSHVDASARSERTVLNQFLVVLCFLSAVMLWLFTHRQSLSIALALSGATVFAALLLARWVKVSLHVAFGAFATILLWPIPLAVFGGALATGAVVWSRIVLRRHGAADVMAGLLLGSAAGAAYRVLVV